SVLTVLGTGAPQVASFFITYVIFNALVVKPIMLLRPWGLLIFCIRYRLAATPRARCRLWALQEMPFGPLLPNHTIIVLLTLVFACVHPLVTPAGLLYFTVNQLLERYQQVYVWRRSYESGGKLWRQAVLQVMVGLYMAQITMLGLLGIKRFK
ncbi:RSN1_7TM domain-containing protein, partial [Haematococcus lacustris]